METILSIVQTTFTVALKLIELFIGFMMSAFGILLDFVRNIAGLVG